ncbi:MAG: RHS repeat-associated core domain-containing protein, partial [bacterium]
MKYERIRTWEMKADRSRPIPTAHSFYSNCQRILDRGYTGHEHLLDHDIINMNGRIYDPITAQFMQADNYIQSPEDFISYNRYAYCLYNPFKYTDPSGEDPVYLWDAVHNMWAYIPDDDRVYGDRHSFVSGGYTLSYINTETDYGFGGTIANNSEGLTSNWSGGSSQYGCGATYTREYAKATLGKLWADPIKHIDIPLPPKGPIKVSQDFFGEQSITPNNPELDFYLAVSMAGDALLFTKWLLSDILEAAASRALGRESARLADEIGEWLGKGATKHFNKA